MQKKLPGNIILSVLCKHVLDVFLHLGMTGFIGKFTRNVYVFDETNVIWDEDGFSYLPGEQSPFTGVVAVRQGDEAGEGRLKTLTSYQGGKMHGGEGNLSRCRPPN